MILINIFFKFQYKLAVIFTGNWWTIVTEQTILIVTVNVSRLTCLG